MQKAPDWLPDGTDSQEYLKEDQEWSGLVRRIGKPRILTHVYFSEVIDWVHRKFERNPDNFSYFEAGCGHGNDLRAIRNILTKHGRFLGVDISKAEIIQGLDFYRRQASEDTDEARKLFGVGNLQNLKQVKIWDEEKGDFSLPLAIEDAEFDLVYLEAVLQGSGYGVGTYQKKKATAQKILSELCRICRPEGRFFGRVKAFGPDVDREKQFALLRETNNWRFIPKEGEFLEMLKQAGFNIIKSASLPHERGESDPAKKNILRTSFLVKK